MTAKPRAVIWLAVSSKRQAADDKISLEYQEARAREWCEAEGYEIVKILEIRGHSRSEADIVKLLEDYEEAGVTAYKDLRAMWYAKSFDVLVAYSTDRFGRSSTAINWVIENTITKGMQIYLLEDGGMMTRTDFRYKSGISSISVTMPMDNFRDKTHQARLDLIRRGLPTGSKVALSHTRVRDPVNGKDVALIINEDTRQLYMDIAELLLKRIPWGTIGLELYQRYGYTGRTGKPLSSGTLYGMIHNPFAWGHTADRYRKEANKHARGLKGEWIFHEGPPIPEGVTIHYNNIPAMYTGELAAELIAELKRRMSNGNWKPNETYRFSRLVMCGTCGSFMSTYSTHKKRYGMRCAQMFLPRAQIKCTQSGVLTTEFLTGEIAKMLDQWIANNATLVDPAQSLQVERVSVRLAAQIKQLNAQISTAIAEQSKAPEILAGHYREEINKFAAQLESLHQQLARAHEVESKGVQNLVLHRRTMDEIRAMTPELFWAQPDSVINQKLHLLLGDWRFVATPIGVGLVPRPAKRV